MTNNLLAGFLMLVLSNLPPGVLNKSCAWLGLDNSQAKHSESALINPARNTAAMADQLVEAGALIIDMGVSPQTYENGLKPYGLVFELIKTHKIPVLWIINPTKSSDKNIGYDDIDFFYDGNIYSGGPFIVEEQYRSLAVESTISAWEAKGVQTVTTTSDITVPVFTELTVAPNWTLDLANGPIVEAGFNQADIPELNNGDSNDPNFIYKSPDNLDCCDYLYAMPHADPEWDTHGTLASWVLNEASGGCRGWIWAACHAISALENSFDDQTPDVSEQMNFLSNKTGDANIGDAPWGENSLVLWTEHDDPDGDYVYNNASNVLPFMQFMGDIGTGMDNGSEQIYMPYSGTSWRSSTTIAIYDDNHPDIGGIAAAEAAKLAFGPAYGNGSYSDYAADNGWVMYLGGHSVGGTEEEQVAIYRSFFNFSFMSAQSRGSEVAYVNQPPSQIEQLTSINLSGSATGGSGDYTFNWTADPALGSFSSSNIIVGEGVTASTTYTAPSTTIAYDIVITLTVSNACGIETYDTQVVSIVPAEEPPSCSDETVYIAPNSQAVVDLTTLTNDLNLNLDPSGHTILSQTSNGSVSDDNNGTATYLPDFNFLGTDSYTYLATDNVGNTCSGIVTIIIDCPNDASNNQIWGTVFIDDNENGLIDGADGPYGGGVTIYLYEDNSPVNGLPDGLAVQTSISDATGSYNFIVYDDYLTSMSATYILKNSRDDAREKTDGDVEKDKADHKITKSGNDALNGFRFRSITLPSNAIIDNAYIIFTAKDDKALNPASVRMQGQNFDNPGRFNNCNLCFGISNRNRTTASVDWTNIEAWSNNQTYNSPDISPIIQELVDNWPGGLTNIVILTESISPGFEERKTYSYDSDPNKAPKLVVEYSVPLSQDFNYIVEIDISTIGGGVTLTTPDHYDIAFNNLGTSSCYNNFGIITSNCATIYTNGFIRYNRIR